MKKLLLLLSCTVLLCGCTKSNIVSPDAAVPETEMVVGGNPDLAVKDGIIIDWTEVGKEMDDTFTDQSEYPMSESVNYAFDESTKSFELTLMVKEGTTKEDAVEYATAVIKGLNDEIATQDFSYETSSETSYGGFFAKNDLKLMVIPGTPYTDKDSYLIDQVILAGEDTPVEAKAD